MLSNGKSFPSLILSLFLCTEQDLTLIVHLLQYARTKTGIAPEFVQFRGEDFSITSAPFYILRPETVEAFYYLSVLTGDPIYRVSFSFF